MTQTPETLPRTAPIQVILTGYLGRDREIRHTRSRTIERDGCQRSDAEHEYVIPPSSFTTRSKEYIVLSVATHHGRNGKAFTKWHRLIVWNVDRAGILHPARLCRKGTKVRVTGRSETFTTEDGRTIAQIVVTNLELLDLRAPEVP